MERSLEKPYFFSIEPFWPLQSQKAALYNADGTICVKRFDWGERQSLKCIPGNAQIALMLQEGPEDFRGWCYGVLQENRELSLHGMQNVLSIHFSPGSFSKIMHVPAKDIDPNGTPIEDILTPLQIGALRDAIADPSPMTALLLLVLSWEEHFDRRFSLGDYLLSREISFSIWNKSGLIHMKELEERTGYCERHLRNIAKDYIGVSPKQLCRQTRFQHSLQYLGTAGCEKLVTAAVSLGYTDQAHMAHEFKELLGHTPSEYQHYANLKIMK